MLCIALWVSSFITSIVGAGVGDAATIVVASAFENAVEPVIALVTGVFVHFAFGAVERDFAFPGLGIEQRIDDLELIENLVVVVAGKTLNDLARWRKLNLAAAIGILVDGLDHKRVALPPAN